MFRWRKRAASRWLAANEPALHSHVGDQLAIVERPGRRTKMLEVVCSSQKEARALMRDFGGAIETIPTDWLAVYARDQKRAPLRIGKRLIVSDEQPDRPWTLPVGARLVIPAGAAFGTGDHATTAMSLRMLERNTRRRTGDWSFADLGTGSGILALAARSFGAGYVIAIDNDPGAIRTAKQNAVINRISGVEFGVADVRKWRPRRKVDVLTANLFSELLIEILPRLKAFLATDAELILSGVLRSQETSVVRALRANRLKIKEIRRRGKWIAMSADSAL